MDSTPASLFDSFDQDFQHIVQSIKAKLDGEVKTQQGEQRKATLRRVELDLDEADDIISQLELEIQGIPLSVRSPYNARLKQSKALLLQFKKTAKDLHSQASRADLLGPGGSKRGFAATADDPYGERNDRTRLLAGTETLSDGSRRIADSTRIALETEEAGADILRNLQVQRETIQHSRDTLRTADTSIDRASGTIKKMTRQMYKQRFILGGIAVVLVAVVVLILYFKLIHQRH